MPPSYYQCPSGLLEPLQSYLWHSPQFRSRPTAILSPFSPRNIHPDPLAPRLMGLPWATTIGWFHVISEAALEEARPRRAEEPAWGPAKGKEDFQRRSPSQTLRHALPFTDLARASLRSRSPPCYHVSQSAALGWRLPAAQLLSQAPICHTLNDVAQRESDPQSATSLWVDTPCSPHGHLQGTLTRSLLGRKQEFIASISTLPHHKSAGFLTHVQMWSIICL